MQSQMEKQQGAGFRAGGVGATGNEARAVTGSSGLSRRKFIAGSALASAAFMIVPSHVLGRGGAKSPNEKLNIAGIGIGGQGGQDIGQMTTENIVALCDVDWSHAAGMFRKFPDAKQ